MNSLPLTHNSTPGFRIPTGIRSHRQLLKSFRFNAEISSKYCYNSKRRSNCSACGALSRREALIGVGIMQVVNPMKYLAAFAVESDVCEFSVAPSGLGYCDKVVGTGAEAVKGQLIKAHYVGRLEDGKVFDSSYNRGKPLTFRVGVGEVIKGWDEGIVGGDGIPAMLAGGKRKLRIPPQLGYGMRGAGCQGGSCIIPPDSVLLFDVEFVGKVAGAGN